MGDNRKNLLHRRNIVENLIERPPFRYEKSKPVLSPSLGSEEIERVINISLSENPSDLHDTSRSNIQTSNHPCQTTINLYINDPHMMQKNWEKYVKIPPRRKMRNEIVLGKNVPDHTLMKNLLGDLGVKKYSSAPNMTNKYLNNRKILSNDRCPSDRFFTQNTTEVSHDVQTSGFFGMMNHPEKRTTFLYVNEGRSGGDFKKGNIEKIDEEEEETIMEETNNCPVHSRDHSVMKLMPDCKTNQEDKSGIDFKDPLKRFKRKPFRLSQFSKDPAILYRDLATKSPQNEKPEQPRRKMPTFNVRTQMVRDILNANPEMMYSYQSGLMRNHKRLFETLRHKNFQHITNENDTLQKAEILPRIRTDEKIDSINEIQSKLVLSGKNKRPICSVESHGSYEEYKRNLVKGPDGTLSCKNTDYCDDEVWSRAETRNIITSEFVKDKIKKFDKLFSRKQEDSYGSRDENEMSKEKSSKHRYAIADYSYQGTLSHNLLNGEDVSFPKETKNAMTRLLSKNSKMFLEQQDSNKNRKVNGAIREIRNLPVKKEYSTDSSTSCEDRTNGENNRCWPGVAERVRSSAEENTT